MCFARFFIGLVLVVFVNATFADDVITNACELTRLPNDEKFAGRRFELTGTILTSYPHLFVSNGQTLLLQGDINQQKAKPGDVVSIVGVTQRQNTYYVLKSSTITHGAVPKPRLLRSGNLAESFQKLEFVSVRGLAITAFQDEIDPEYVYLVLDCEGTTVIAATAIANLSPADAVLLEGSEIELSGAFMPMGPRPNSRMYLGCLFKIWSEHPIRILKPADDELDAVPELTSVPLASPDKIHKIGRRRIEGHVLAAWDKSNLLLESASGTIHRISMSNGQPLPKPGDRITATGKAETDLYHLNLAHARCRIDSPGDRQPEPPEALMSPGTILCNDRGEQMIKPAYGGKTVRFRGIFRSSVWNGSDEPNRRFELDCKSYIVPVLVGEAALTGNIPSVGSTVEVSGCCVMDVDNWLPKEPIPRIKGIFIVTRTPDDITTISAPPWWSPTKFVIALCSALAVLIGFLIWNHLLRRLVEKRSKDLLDEQIAHAKSEFRTMERTRLAIELHDTLSQDLAAVSCQIAATTSQFRENPAEALRNLSTSETMLLSCRTELKRCLWDLRNDTLEDEDITHAVVSTLKPLAGNAHLAVRFNVQRSSLTDSSAHALLCIIRELVSNAIVHGRATDIKIAGSLEGGRILFSVIDNGCGFNPSNRPGPDTGHFGLAGIQTRIKRLRGKITIKSARSRGTRVAIAISIVDPEDK